ncbi:MAG: hypothetical protein ACRC0L_13095 [Angustibacter sp.]
MSWALMVAVAMGLMWVMRYTEQDWLDAVLIRLAASAFVGAGLIGASGWLGEVMTSGTDWVMKTGDSLGSQAFGTAVVWIVTAGLMIAWILSMLPEQWIKFDPPDWLVISGLFIPSLQVSVPGLLGQVLRNVTTWAGSGINMMISGLVS